MLLLFAVGANAQFTKVFETPVSAVGKIPANKAMVYGAFDAEKTSDVYPPYVSFRSGDNMNVLNLQTLEIEYKLDLTSIIDTSYVYTYVAFYKNLFKSDNSWSCLLMPYTATTGGYGLHIYSGGKITKTDIVAYSTFPAIRRVDEKLLLLIPTKTSYEVYLVRNDLPQTTAIPYSSPYISALKKLSDEHETKLFNAIGQKIDDSYYGTLPDYLKKTIYAK